MHASAVSYPSPTRPVPDSYVPVSTGWSLADIGAAAAVAAASGMDYPHALPHAATSGTGAVGGDLTAFGASAGSNLLSNVPYCSPYLHCMPPYSSASAGAPGHGYSHYSNSLLFGQTPTPHHIQQIKEEEARTARRDSPKVDLVDRELWRRFDRLNTEMVITKSGR